MADHSPVWVESITVMSLAEATNATTATDDTFEVVHKDAVLYSVVPAVLFLAVCVVGFMCKANKDTMTALESKRQFRWWLPLCTTVFPFACFILCGIKLYSPTGECHDDFSCTPSLAKGFDTLFRRAGPLMPLLLVLFRFVAIQLDGGLKKVVTLTNTLVAYILIIVLRIVVFKGITIVHKDLMADHVYLACSVAIVIQAEMVFILENMVIVSNDGARMILAGAFGLAAILLFILSFDMMQTTMYYHPPMNSAIGLAAGLTLFQLPVTFLLTQNFDGNLEQEEADGNYASFQT